MRGDTSPGRSPTRYQAATADGADRSGMTALTIPVITNFAVDAAMAVALATPLVLRRGHRRIARSVSRCTCADHRPTAVIAPPHRSRPDRLQRGRRIAMATTFGAPGPAGGADHRQQRLNSQAGQLHYDPWVLYPCAGDDGAVQAVRRAQIGG